MVYVACHNWVMGCSTRIFIKKEINITWLNELVLKCDFFPPPPCKSLRKTVWENVDVGVYGDMNEKKKSSF